MQEMKVRAFVEQFRDVVAEQEGRFAFFLGAGCSVTSNIPAAAQLTRDWLRELHRRRDDDGPEDVAEWAAKTIPGYDDKDAGACYAKVLRRLYPMQVQRQRAIERVTMGRDPGFGYGVLAQLLAHPTVGPRCNLVLTTNFDDLVADALYVCTRSRPRVIVHDSLAHFAEAEGRRPLVVKLHGDALLDPKNLEDETDALPPRLRERLLDLLDGRGLVFLGYGGNDASVLSLVRALPEDALRWGVYWINAEKPRGAFAEWLEAHPSAFWVKHLDFDELMLLFRKAFDLPHPDRSRFDELFKKYIDAFGELEKRLAKRPESEAKRELVAAATAAGKALPDARQIALEALKIEATAPSDAERLFQEGVARLPDAHELRNDYGIFLWRQNRRADARAQFEAAHRAKPGDAAYLGNFALASEGLRPPEEVDAQYRRALAIDPGNLVNRSNYARFLWQTVGDDAAAAREYARLAEAAPTDPGQLGDYAWFLIRAKGDAAGARALLQRAVDLWPNNPAAVGNFGVYLYTVERDLDGAERAYRKALELNPADATLWTNLAILLLERRQDAEALKMTRSAVKLFDAAADPGGAVIGRTLLYAFEPKTRAATMAEIRRDLEAGGRRRGADWSTVFDRLAADRNPELPTVRALAAVISDGGPLAALDVLPAWTAARKR